MKTFTFSSIILFAILMFPTLGITQSKSNKIFAKVTGLGEFKIDKTITSDIISKLNVEEIEDILDTSRTSFSNNLNVKYKHLDKPYSDLLIYHYFSINAKYYFIKSYKIADDSLDAILIFNNDTLIKIVTNYMFEAMGIGIVWYGKYGKGREEVFKTKISCSNSYRQWNEEQFNSSEYWKNGTIKAHNYFLIYFDNNCKKKLVSYLEIYNEKKISKIKANDLKSFNNKEKILKDLEKQKVLDSDL